MAESSQTTSLWRAHKNANSVAESWERGWENMGSYLVLKSLHLIGVVTWFAGLFYIFRLYVYHVENQDKPDVVAVLKVMERRLYYAITWPAMIFTLIFGVWLLCIQPELLRAGWLHAKFLMLLVLFGYHFFAGYTRGRFAKNDIFLTSRQCRFINEVPTIVLLIVVPLAVLKPF